MVSNHQRHTCATAALIGVAVAFACAPAAGQDEAADPPTKQTDADADGNTAADTALAYTEARFALTSTPNAADPTSADNPATEEAEASPQSLLITGAAALHGPTSTGGSDDTGTLAARHWMLGEWPTETVATDILWTGAAVVERAATPHSSGNRITVRTSGQFGVEAAQLTPLTGGKQMFALELADGFTLAGVGSRRMWTERSRAFVLAAEAGWQLTPHAGLHLGYEVFQAPTGGVLPADAGGDSIFARFQLRF
ncbi:MAG: hypothetical protein Q9O74_03890 [Planctomycetota bacterium]|nr:hypothetical protein [Planctomycetota bacterium]